MSARRNKTSRTKDGRTGLSLPQLVQRARIEAVDVVGVRAERAHASPMAGLLTLPDTLKVSVDVRVQHPTVMPEERASFVVGVSCRWREPGGKADLARVDVDVRVAYVFADVAQAPDAAMTKQFATQLAAHHAWPFLRERVRTLSGELGVPLVLPLHHAGLGPAGNP